MTTVLLAIPTRAAGDGDKASDVPSPDARKAHLAEALAILAANILDDRETPGKASATWPD